MSTTTPADRDWAKLLSDLLEFIAGRLSAIDCIRFAAVCKPWCSAASPRVNNLSPLQSLLKKPCLLLVSDDYTECLLQDVLSSSDGPRRCHHRIDPLPELLQGEKRFVGSQFGWVAVVDKFSNPSLVNPLTRSQIHLPPIATLSELVKPIYRDGSLCGYHHYYDCDHNFFDSSLQTFRRHCIKKLVLSSDPSTGGDFSALASFCGTRRRLIYLRPGGTEWSVVKNIDDDMIDDIIFSHGMFLAVANRGLIYVLGLDGPIVRVLNDVNGGPEQVFYPCELMYLVESADGAPMVVRRLREERDGEMMSKTTSMVLMKLDREVEDWIPVMDLKDQALFLGASCSMLVSATDVPGLKENCIYFTDDHPHFEYSRQSWLEFCSGLKELESMKDALMIPDIGIYNMKDGTVELINTPGERYNWISPIWIMPSVK